VMGLVEDTYTDLRPHLVNYLRKRRPHDAEDLADEVLARCWRAERAGKTINLGYVYRTASHLLVDQGRRDGRTVPTLRASFDPTAQAAEAVDLDRLLEQLSEPERLVVLLRAAGYTASEIAALSGSSVDSVKQRFKRLRRRMRGARGEP
jgi:RNA polymerase sigma factor (sigma-70 family)